MRGAFSVTPTPTCEQKSCPLKKPVSKRTSARPSILAIAQIEKQLGKARSCGWCRCAAGQIAAISTGAINLDGRHGIGGCRGSDHRYLRPGIVRQERPYVCTSCQCAARRGSGRLCRRTSTPSIRVCPQALFDVENLLCRSPTPCEQAIEIVEIRFLRAVDRGDRSVAALVPAEIEGEMGESHMGLQARLMSGASQDCRCHQPHPLRRGVHQPAAREDRGHVRQPGHHHGRKALSSTLVRLDIRRIGPVKEREAVIGSGCG